MHVLVQQLTKFARVSLPTQTTFLVTREWAYTIFRVFSYKQLHVDINEWKTICYAVERQQ